MCGVFGFVAAQGESVDMRRLRDVAAETERRGDHAFGFAWADADGQLWYYKQAGKITNHLGHCRWATHGDKADNRNNHPHLTRSGAYVHNGVIADYQSIARRLGVSLETKCDSEIIGKAFDECAGSPLRRLQTVTNMVAPTPRARDPWGRFSSGSGFVVLGLWPDSSGRVGLYGARKGNPLNVREAREGTYVASLPKGMGRGVVDVRDGTVFRLGHKQTEVCHV
jgi:hypothetical protein